jgi:outer membrane lipoprotein-sorting protein
MHSFRSTGSCSARRMALGGLIASATVVSCGSPHPQSGAAPAPAQSDPSTGEAIIRAMHDRYATTWYRTLTFTQKTTRRSSADTMVIETWREKAMVPGKLRIDMEAASGNLSVIFANDSTYIMRGDTVRRAPGTNYLLIIGFDVYRQPVDSTVAALSNHKPPFPMTPVHEETWEGRPVYVIGAAAGDTTSAQMWIDKERLVFVRALFPTGPDNPKTSDTRFDNYVGMPGGGWLSERVEFYVDGQLRQREEYSDVHTDVDLSPSIFEATGGQ